MIIKTRMPFRLIKSYNESKQTIKIEKKIKFLTNFFLDIIDCGQLSDNKK